MKYHFDLSALRTAFHISLIALNEPLNGNAGSLERVLACVLNDESRNRCPRLGRQRLPAYFSLRPLRGQSHNKLAFGDPAQPSRRVHSQR
jgi:hypothetical protein